MKNLTPPSRRLLALLGIVLVVTAASLVVTRLGPLAPTRITVAQVRSEPLKPFVFGIGTVEARQSWLLGPTTAGRVLRVHVDAGQSVRTGQLLAEMDPVDLQQRLLAQDAALSKAHSGQLAAEAQATDATARLELAQTALSRQKGLAQQGFISASALEAKEQEQQSAQAALRVAQANMQAARQDIQRLQAERGAAAQQNQNTRLLAPADAVVISRDAEPGTTLVAGQPVLRLANPATLRVRLRVDQARSAGLTAGMPAQIVLRSRPQQPLSGRVDRVELQADAVTEERIVQVSFDQVPLAATIGEMAEVTLAVQPIDKALVVPQAAVQVYQGRAGVWRLRDDALEFVPVLLGASSLDGRVQLLSGPAQGDTVVVHSEKPIGPGSGWRVVDSLVKKAAP